MIAYIYVASKQQDPRFHLVCSHSNLLTPSLSLMHMCSHKHISTGEPRPSTFLSHFKTGESWNTEMEETIKGYIGNVILNPWHSCGSWWVWQTFAYFMYFSSKLPQYILRWTKHTLLMPVYRRAKIRIQFSLALLGSQQSDLLKAMHLVSDGSPTPTQSL